MRTILVVREFDQFSRIFVENDFAVVNCPTIIVGKLEKTDDFEQKIELLENYDGVFLTSFSAAKVFQQKLDESKKDFSGKVYLLGRRSFEVLKNSYLNVFFDESANNAREMLNKIAPEDLKNKRFLFVRGDKSLNVIADFLKDKAVLDETVVYKTEQRKVAIKEINEVLTKFENKLICCACFFSPSAAESFIKQFGAEVLHQTKIATIGKTTAEYFARQKIRVNFVSSKSNSEVFAIELIKYLKNEV